MSKKVRRKFTAEEKVALIRLHLIEKQPVSEICDRNQISVNQFYRWQNTLFANGAVTFNVNKTTKKDAKDKKIEELKAKVLARDEGIAELMMEHVKLKKKHCQS